MILDLIQQRLRDEIPDLRHVQGSADFAEQLERNVLPPQTPAAIVIRPGLDAASEQHAARRMTQKITETIGVILVVEARRATGDVAQGRIEQLEDHLRQALTGWKPEPGWEPFVFVRQRLLGLRHSTLFSQSDFRASWRFTVETEE